MDIDYFSRLMMALMGLVIATNIVVEVVKKATWDRLPTNLVAVVAAQVLTLAYGGAMASVYAVSITWYMVVGAIVAGIAVAFGAMFGFDKLRQLLEQAAGLRGGGNDG